MSSDRVRAMIVCSASISATTPPGGAFWRRSKLLNSDARIRAPSAYETSPSSMTGTPIETKNCPVAGSRLSDETAGRFVSRTARTQSSLTRMDGCPNGTAVLTTTREPGSTSRTACQPGCSVSISVAAL